MVVGTKSKKLNSFKIITLLFLLILDGATSSSQNTTKCLFKYFFVFGDGFGDTGNSIRIPPEGPFLPAARLPYGKTFPGFPTGRWSDGRVDTDYAAASVGLPKVRPYLSLGRSCSSAKDGVVFSVATSPILDRPFFKRRGVTIPSFATPLASQINWFTKYLRSVSSNPTEVRKRVANSLMLFTTTHSHDFAYPIVQGKSIQQVSTYVPFRVDALIHGARTVIQMGAKRVVISGGGPLGCCPYILTALHKHSTNTSDYDALGCSESVNALIISYNTALQQAITQLRTQYPNVNILYIDDFLFVTTIITQMIASGGEDIGLRACCGIGGKYNYDSRRFCGSQGVPVCDNPNEYIFWDGIHYTQEVNRRIVEIVAPVALLALNCTSFSD